VEGSSFVCAASPDEPTSAVPGTLSEKASLAELPPLTDQWLNLQGIAGHQEAAPLHEGSLASYAGIWRKPLTGHSQAQVIVESLKRCNRGVHVGEN